MRFIILAIALFSSVLAPLSAYYPQAASHEASANSEDDYDEAEDEEEEEEEDNI